METTEPENSDTNKIFVGEPSIKNASGPISDLTIIIWSAILIIGMLMLGSLYLPAVSPEQCPSNYTQAQVDESNCIIGANIGAGMIWLLGIAATGTGMLGLAIALLIRYIHEYRQQSSD